MMWSWLISGGRSHLRSVYADYKPCIAGLGFGKNLEALSAFIFMDSSGNSMHGLALVLGSPTEKKGMTSHCDLE